MIPLKKYLYALLAIITCAFLQSQHNRKDSLMRLIKKQQLACPEPCMTDSLMLRQMSALSLEYLNAGGFDSTKIISKEVLKITSARLKIPSAKIAEYVKGISRETPGYRKIVDLCIRSAISFNIIGIAHHQKGEYPAALENYLAALKINENVIIGADSNVAVLRKRHICGVLNNLGNVFKELDEYDKALDYYNRAVKLSEETGDKRSLAMDLAGIGIVYYKKQEPEKALEYYKAGLKIAEEIGDRAGMAADHDNMANIYSDQGQESKKNSEREILFAKARDHYATALKINSEIENWNGVMINIGNMGGTQILTKEYKPAATNLYRALFLSDSLGTLDFKKEWYKFLSDLYEVSDVPLPDSAGGKILSFEQMRIRSKTYFMRFVSVRDSIFSQENKKQLVQKEMNFEFEKKEAVEKSAHEKQMAIAAAESKKQKMVIWFTVFGLLLVVIFAGVVLRSLRITRKQKSVIELQKQMVEIQKHMVEEKQKEILDSIYYARRIQTALITSEKYIERMLKKFSE